MSKSVFKRTEVDNLVHNLRGEVGAIVESWTLMREYNILTNQLHSDKYKENFQNSNLNKRRIIRKKLADDVISRLSELANKSYGKLNFHFATQKLKKFTKESEEFHFFILNNNFTDRRNEYISHKKLAPTWEGFKREHPISYLTITKALAKALIIMKKIDGFYLGSDAHLKWHILRKHRYRYDIPARAQYLMMHHVKIK